MGTLLGADCVRERRHHATSTAGSADRLSTKPRRVRGLGPASRRHFVRGRPCEREPVRERSGLRPDLGDRSGLPFRAPPQRTDDRHDRRGAAGRVDERAVGSDVETLVEGTGRAIRAAKRLPRSGDAASRRPKFGPVQLITQRASKVARSPRASRTTTRASRAPPSTPWTVPAATSTRRDRTSASTARPTSGASRWRCTSQCRDA